MKLAFVGGTGPAGIGLAARLARAGHDVAIGSRASDRAAAAADEVRALAPGGSIAHGTNDDVVGDAEVVFLTVPPDAQGKSVEALAAALAGKVVVSLANPLRVEGGRVSYEPPPAGSLAEEAARAAPGARVVSMFQEIHVGRWRRAKPIDSDTVVCGDDDDAKRVAMRLATDAGVRPVDGGGLANSRFVEGFVVVLVDINLRYRASTSLRITGLPGP